MRQMGPHHHPFVLDHYLEGAVAVNDDLRRGGEKGHLRGPSTRKGIFLKIGAFLGGTPILGPQGPKKGDPPRSAPIDH